MGRTRAYLLGLMVTKCGALQLGAILRNKSKETDKLAWALSELDKQGMMHQSTLAQREESGEGPPEAMEKYLEIARELVKLNDELPTMKLCMADVAAGKYTPSIAANLAMGESRPKELDDPDTGRPMQIIVSGKAPNLIDEKTSKLISGLGKTMKAKGKETTTKKESKKTKKKKKKSAKEEDTADDSGKCLVLT